MKFHQQTQKTMILTSYEYHSAFLIIRDTSDNLLHSSLAVEGILIWWCTWAVKLNKIFQMGCSASHWAYPLSVHKIALFLRLSNLLVPIWLPWYFLLTCEFVSPWNSYHPSPFFPMIISQPSARSIYHNHGKTKNHQQRLTLDKQTTNKAAQTFLPTHTWHTDKTGKGVRGRECCFSFQ